MQPPPNERPKTREGAEQTRIDPRKVIDFPAKYRLRHELMQEAVGLGMLGGGAEPPQGGLEAWRDLGIRLGEQDTRFLVQESIPQACGALDFYRIAPANGAELNAVIDCLAEGDDGFFIIDHKSGAAPDPEERFTDYWPQLSAYAEAVRRVFPGKPVRHVAVNWMNEGKLSILDLAHV